MNYKSNMNRVLTKLKKSIVSAEAIDKLTLDVAAGVRASNLRRIHNEGKNVRNGKIGSYSTTPIYVNPANSPRKFTPEGKPTKFRKKTKKTFKFYSETSSSGYIEKTTTMVAVGNKTFKNGKPHKIKYFAQGYKGFRDKIGRETAYVNLQLTGSLKADFNILKSSNGYTIGFSKKAEIAEGLEKHFKSQIWGLSQTDKDIVNEIVNNFIKKNI